MSIHNIHFHDCKNTKTSLKFPAIFVFLSLRKNFLGTQKRVRINHDKRAIGLKIIKVLLFIFLYFYMSCTLKSFQKVCVCVCVCVYVCVYVCWEGVGVTKKDR